MKSTFSVNNQQVFFSFFSLSLTLSPLVSSFVGMFIILGGTASKSVSHVLPKAIRHLITAFRLYYF